MTTPDAAILQSAYEAMPPADREWFWRIYEAFCAGRNFRLDELAALERRVLKLELALSVVMADGPKH